MILRQTINSYIGCVFIFAVGLFASTYILGVAHAENPMGRYADRLIAVEAELRSDSE